MKKEPKKIAEVTPTNEELISQDTFERLKTKNKMRVVRRRIFYVLTGLTVCLLFLVICGSVFFRVSEIIVTGNTVYKPELITESCGIKLDTNLYAVDAKAVEKLITIKYPYIDSVKVIRRLPSAIELAVTEETPVYYVEIDGEYFVLSDTLRVLDRTPNIGELRSQYGLKELVTPPVAYAVVGRTIKFKRESNYDTVINMVSWIKNSELYEKTQKINVSDKYYMFFIYDKRYKIILGDSTNLDIKLDSALQILGQMDSMLQNSTGTIDVQDIKVGFVQAGGSIN